MENYKKLNEAIQKRKPHRRYEENTYFTSTLWEAFCNEYKQDYKYIAIYGPYRSKYKWTPDQCKQMYDKSPDSWTDGIGVVRLYDWGKGENQVVKNRHDQDWHVPQLDHIVSRDEAKLLGWTQEQIDDPSNMQVLPTNLNRMLSNITEAMAPALIPAFLKQFKQYQHLVV